MKNIAFTIAMALCGVAAYAADEPTATATTDQGMPCAHCKPCPKAAQCDGTAWVDIETLTIEAANGDPIAQYAVAYITETGMGDTPKDPEKAQELYKQALPGLKEAAEKGHPVACRALSHMYAEGKGVDTDKAKAAEYMKDCAKASHGKCKHHGWKDCCKHCDKKKDQTPPAPAEQPAA